MNAAALDQPLPRYRCPACHSSEGLWEGVEVPGWRSLDEHLRAVGQRDVDWFAADWNGEFGCSCGWAGPKDALQRLGIDGEPLPTIHPHQLALTAA